jgi:hypothetical protein
MRFVWAIAMVLVMGVGAAGCGGYSSDEAKDVCDLERSKPCQTDQTYEACISCFEECGSSCATAESCPVQYICSE